MVVKSGTSSEVQSQLKSILDEHNKPTKENTKPEKREYGFPGNDLLLDTTGGVVCTGVLETTSGNNGGNYGGRRRY